MSRGKPPAQPNRPFEEPRRCHAARSPRKRCPIAAKATEKKHQFLAKGGVCPYVSRLVWQPWELPWQTPGARWTPHLASSSSILTTRSATTQPRETRACESRFPEPSKRV